MERPRISGALSFTVVLAGLALTGCGGTTPLTPGAGVGPRPTLPPPSHSLVPVINVVSAKGWPEGATPKSAEGTAVTAFAQGLQHPRWVYVLPNGDVLVAETNAPPRPEDGKGLRGWLFKHYQKKAGGIVPSANRITLLRDADGDGIAEVRTPFLEGLNAPFGMALVGHDLYVANTDAVVVFPYETGQTRITASGKKLTGLPAGPLNHHWTKSLLASRDGSKLYVGVGSNSNAAENGIDQEHERAAIWEIDRASGSYRVFAAGLRNPVGLAWEPQRGTLFAVVNERDELGNDLVPDYLTSVQDGAFYGWPYSYYGDHVDARVKPPRPDLVARAIAPDYALGSHTASLGLAYAEASSLPPPFRGGMFVGQHGSWNRRPRSGYKVVFVPFTDGRPSGEPVDVLTDFVLENGDARGRPVGVALDAQGGLLVADDVGNAIWRVRGDSARSAATSPSP